MKKTDNGWELNFPRFLGISTRKCRPIKGGIRFLRRAQRIYSSRPFSSKNVKHFFFCKESNSLENENHHLSVFPKLLNKCMLLCFPKHQLNLPRGLTQGSYSPALEACMQVVPPDASPESVRTGERHPPPDFALLLTPPPLAGTQRKY